MQIVSSAPTPVRVRCAKTSTFSMDQNVSSRVQDQCLLMKLGNLAVIALKIA